MIWIFIVVFLIIFIWGLSKVISIEIERPIIGTDVPAHEYIATTKKIWSKLVNKHGKEKIINDLRQGKFKLLKEDEVNIIIKAIQDGKI